MDGHLQRQTMPLSLRDGDTGKQRSGSQVAATEDSGTLSLYLFSFLGYNAVNY
jgi:hypothetical protein